MKTFIIQYHATPKAQRTMQEQKSPESMQQVMQAWSKWADECGEHLIDFGLNFFNGKQIGASGMIEFEADVIGQSILEAENMDSVMELAKKHPHLEWNGCSIRVYETMKMPRI